MSQANNDRLKYFQREIQAPYQEGSEFARHFPKIGRRLAFDVERSHDPHVDRILQSVAFLSGRIRQDMDSEHERLNDMLLDTLYPHLLNPIPAISIARFTATPGSPLTEVEAGHPLVTQSFSGDKCYFRSCYPVSLLPLEVQHTEFQVNPLTEKSELTLTCCRTDQNGPPLPPLKIQRMRLFIQGRRRYAYSVYEMLFADCDKIYLDHVDNEQVGLPKIGIQPVGFSHDQAVLNFPNNVHQGIRLLQEYFACPEKFLFFDLCFEKPIKLDNALSIKFTFSDLPDLEHAFQDTQLLLGCTPVINLFQRISEPLKVSGEKLDYPIVVDRFTSKKRLSIHSVLELNSTDKNAQEPIPQYLAYNSQQTDDAELYWLVHRKMPRHGSDAPTVTLSLVDNHQKLLKGGEQVFYAKLLCTNQGLPDSLHAGSPLFSETGLPGVNISLCRKPSTAILPPNKDRRQQLVAMLSLNHLSLLSGASGLSALKILLAQQDFRLDEIASNLFDGIVQVSSKNAMMPAFTEGRRHFCRGLHIDLVLEPEYFSADSAFILATVLNVFFPLYASINTVTRMTLHKGKLGNVWKQWEPRCGNAIIL